MSTNKRALSAAATAGIGLAIVGGAAVANAATKTVSLPQAQGYGYAVPGYGAPGQQGQGGEGQRGQGQAPHEHTAVTGDELTKVTNAVTAKDSAVTVTTVQKDADGSYDVEGTKAGANVRFEVSADLATITQAQGGRGGHGGQGGSQDTPVTGDEATKVGDAVKAKDSAVTVTSVQKDPDGSYDVLGTKNGQNVMFDVSADLATITQAQQGQGQQGQQGQAGQGRHQRGGQQGQTPGSAPTGAPTGAPTSTPSAAPSA